MIFEILDGIFDTTKKKEKTKIEKNTRINIFIFPILDVNSIYGFSF